MPFPDKQWRKYCSLVGAHFATSPLCFLWTYGNLAPYLDSYYRLHCSSGCYSGSSQWILNMFIASIMPGLLVVGWLTKTLGVKWLGGMSALLCGGALFASAKTVQVSALWTTVLLGFVNGFGLGTSLNSALVSINGWAPKNAATFSGSITSVPPVFAIIQNQIVTAYVNPQNLKPDVQDASKTYFSQQDILERVPYAILIIAGITTGIQLIGIILISDPPNPNHVDGNEAGVHRMTEETVLKEHTLQETIYAPSHKQAITARINRPYGKDNLAYGSSNGSQPLENGVSDDFSKAEKPGKKIHDSSCSQPPPSCSISQAIHTAAFWVNSLYLAVVVYGTVLKNGYFKGFGLIYISNDNLMTVLSSLIPFVEAVLRFSCGFILDRNILSMKDCLVLSLSLNSALFAFFYFAPQVNFLTYAAVVLGLSVSHGQLFVLYTGITFKAFGPENFGYLYGLGFLMASTTILVAAGVVKPILESVGWFWLFITCSAPSTVLLFGTVFTDVRPNMATTV